MMRYKKRLLIIDGNASSENELRQLLEGEQEFTVYSADSLLRALDMIYSEPPDLIIIGQSLKGEAWKDLCKRIKSDPVFGNLPIVLALQSTFQTVDADWNKTPVDDYVTRPFHPREVLSRVHLALIRVERIWDANPLTRLPGNYSIMRQIQSRINQKAPFAVGYVDLDNFKSYNDTYGFMRGDEIIKITARLLANSVKKTQSKQAFVGHIGGDDFVFILPPDYMDGICREIIKNFDMVVGNFYDEKDMLQGYIESVNRKGERESFPLVSLSIAIVTNEHRPINHIGQVSSVAADVKKRVKSMKGSNYVKDIRGSALNHNPGKGN